MSGRLVGKTALVTASAQGIGRATVEAFSREGATIIATDINREKLAELDGLAGTSIRLLDVLDGDAVKAAANEIGAVDVLFNCAGFVHHGSILDISDEDWDFSFNLNIKAMFRMCRAFLPAMIQSGGGSIINMSSVSSSMKGIPLRCVYGSSKAAVIGLTKSISADFMKQGIRCNAVCPGTVQSPSLNEQSTRSTIRCRPARISLPASRLVVLVPLRKLPRWRSTSPRMKALTQQARHL